MFRCQQCDAVVPPHVSAERHVVETRVCRYPARAQANHPKILKGGIWKRETRADPGGVGREIAREIVVCPPCKQALMGSAPGDTNPS
jgi:hypothetical protein